GFAPGAVVSVVTKSGTNKFHGNAFEFLRNEVLNARDFFAQTRDGLKRNQFGASAGGPIVKDRLFVFGNYQGTTERLALNGSTSYVPSDAMKNGDFSALLPGIQLKDPDTGANFPNNFIDPSRFSPISLNIANNFLPSSSDPLGFVVVPGR